jgi:hypothetical protein
MILRLTVFDVERNERRSIARMVFLKFASNAFALRHMKAIYARHVVRRQGSTPN